MLSNTRLTILSGSTFALFSALAAPAAVAATLVSGPSPFAGCTIGGSGTNYVNSEVEPWVAVNPANPSNIIGAWQQDRWSSGGAHGLVAAYTTNGGASWSETPMPFSACAGAGALQYERASDPWVSIGPDGVAYAISISFNDSSNANAVGAAVSRDGGATWGNVQAIHANNEPNLQYFDDKESVTADPVIAGTAYAVWDRLESPNTNPYADLHAAAYRGPTFFSKTTNGGITWSTPKIIVDMPSRQQTIGNQIVVDRVSGTLYNFFDFIKPPFSATAYKVAFIKSTDGGATWTNPAMIADLRSVGVTDPVTGEPIRSGDIIPEPAIDPVSGQLYVAWQDSRFNGGLYDEVALSTSSDGGATWSAPIRVNTPTGRPAFNPSIRVNPNGVVGVTYYDFRDLAAGNTATLPTNIWFAKSSNGGASFGAETHLAGPFDLKTAPNARGFFVGDYQGLEVVGNDFLPFFVQTNSGNLSNRTDVFVTTVTP